MKSQNSKKIALGNGCPVFEKCGGCQLQNLTYEEQLHHKQAKEIGLLGKFGHVSPIIGMENPIHYRNKVQAAFGRDRRGIISGVYQSSSHRIIPVDNCMIEDKKADEIIVTIRKMMDSFKLTVFDERTLRGFLRHVLIKRGFSTGQIMVVMVTGTRNFPCKKDFLRVLLQKHPEITTVVQNVNSRFTNLVLGSENIVLYGSGWIEDRLCGCTSRISPKSFYQINPVQTEKLYAEAIGAIALTGKETVIDAYCGTGTIGIIASKSAGRVIGVELSGDAIRDARENARLNGAANTEFYQGDAGAFLTDFAQEGGKADVVILDPPRAGSTPAFLRALSQVAPKRVAYISCNPETLARDLEFLTKNGYSAAYIHPVDMFPHTDHVETVCLLNRNNE